MLELTLVNIFLLIANAVLLLVVYYNIQGAIGKLHEVMEDEIKAQLINADTLHEFLEDSK